MDKEIKEEELNRKKDWLIVDFGHERYSIDLTVTTYRNHTIKQILDEFMYPIDKLERAAHQGYAYAIDDVYHLPPDADTWFLTEKEKQDLFLYILVGILIIPLDKFLSAEEEEFAAWSFGNTYRKFGVMDYAKYPIDMEEDKDEIQTN